MAEDALLANAHQVLNQTGGEPAETLPALFAGDRSFLCTVPELDPYAEIRDGSHAGPVSRWPAPEPFPDTPGFFAYLGGDLSYMPRILRGLNRCGVAGGVYVHEPTEDMVRDFPRSTFTAYDRPQPYDAVLPSASLVVHHASMGTSLAAMAAGRPQIVVPRHLQNALVVQCLERAGVGVRLPSKVTANQMARAVATMARDVEIQHRALTLGRTIARRDYGDVAGRIAEECLALAGA
jgi:hypothetical protein